MVSAAVFSAPRSLLRCSRPDPPAALARPVARYATQWPQVCRVLRCIRPYCRIWRRSGTWSVNLEKSSKGVCPAGTTKTCQEMYDCKCCNAARRPSVCLRRMETSWKRSGILGRGTLVPSYLPSELYLADSCGGECTRGAVVGSRQAAPRTNRTRIDLGRRGREDFFATWRPQWCIPMPWGGRGPCNAVGGAAVVRVANCWMQLPTQWMGHAIYLGVCGRVRGDGS